jgi:hypothetical protein
MSRTLPSPCLFARAACAGALLLISACGDVPKYKHSNGRFPEWAGYEGKHFYPANGTVTAIDATAHTVTIGSGDKASVFAASVFAITPSTHIVHEGADVTLAELPLNQKVKYIRSKDGKALVSIWFGTRLFQIRPPAGASRQQ